MITDLIWLVAWPTIVNTIWRTATNADERRCRMVLEDTGGCNGDVEVSFDDEDGAIVLTGPYGRVNRIYNWRLKQ